MYHTTYVSIDQINSTRSNIGFTEDGREDEDYRPSAQGMTLVRHTLEHERNVEDGSSAKDGTSALAKGVVTNKVYTMAQPNESATNHREGLAMGQLENWRWDIAMAQP